VRKTTKLTEGGHRCLQAYMLLLLRFYVFFQNPKSRDFLRFFAVLRTFSRTMHSASIENIAVPIVSSRWWVGYWMMSDKFYHNHPVAMATKFKTKSPINLSSIRDIFEMLASNRVFSERGYQMMSVKFKRTYLGCHGNEIWDKRL